MSVNTFEKIKSILVEKAGKQADEIQIDTELGDIGIDSFDFIEFVFYIEDEFDIQIDVNSNADEISMKSVGDIAAAVDQLVLAKSQPRTPGSAEAA